MGERWGKGIDEASMELERKKVERGQWGRKEGVACHLSILKFQNMLTRKIRGDIEELKRQKHN